MFSCPARSMMLTMPPLSGRARLRKEWDLEDEGFRAVLVTVRCRLAVASSVSKSEGVVTGMEVLPGTGKGMVELPLGIGRAEFGGVERRSWKMDK